MIEIFWESGTTSMREKVIDNWFCMCPKRAAWGTEKHFITVLVVVMVVLIVASQNLDTSLPIYSKWSTSNI